MSEEEKNNEEKETQQEETGPFPEEPRNHEDCLLIRNWTTAAGGGLIN